MMTKTRQAVPPRSGDASSPQTTHGYSLRITPRRVCYALLGITGTLLIINLLIIFFRFIVGNEHLRGFIYDFYFDHEANFPSAYSAAAILLSAVLLWKISRLEREKTGGRVRYWQLLSLVFVFLAADEFMALHEYLIVPVKSQLENTRLDSGYLYFGWLVPYIVITLILAMVMLRLLVKLPAWTRNGMLLAAVVFLLGAAGMEMVGGNYWAGQGWAVDGSDEVDLTYALIITLEELLEMLGIIIFIYVLLRYYLHERSDITVHLRLGTDR